MKNNYKFIVIDSLLTGVALWLAFFINSNLLVFSVDFNSYFSLLSIFVIIQLSFSSFWGLYKRMWRYTSLFDLYAILGSVSLASGFSFILILFFVDQGPNIKSILVVYFILNALFTVSSRLMVRVYYSQFYKKSASIKRVKKLILIGAGTTGDKISREILNSPHRDYSIVGFVDDDPIKRHALLHGKKVLCNIEELPGLKINYDELLITAPTASGGQMRRIVKACKATGKRYRTVPALNELINNEVSIDTVRDVAYSDLLGRKEVKLDTISIEKVIRGKRVLITGAGGSIGSELVKQCLHFKPAEIICFDISEEKIYNLTQFTNKNREPTVLKPILGSVIEKNELEKVFSDNRPQIVIHAAAYKHVPIQENHPWAAVKTNIIGTLNLVKISEKYSVDKFVLVSTDKAVNPANIMGATKRVSEKIIQSFNAQSMTTFMAVRFGNVLGSSGSAIPTFLEQIKSGGPITITHPEMTRYFMSIQEASQLILQCSALGKNGEVFLLDMGKPIKIVQMAKDLIRLSGFEPEKEIPIVYTGLRPGEKLYEELQLFEEIKVVTKHDKIMILKQNQATIPWVVFYKKLESLIEIVSNLDSDKIQLALMNILPNYQPRSYKSLASSSYSEDIFDFKVEA